MLGYFSIEGRSHDNALVLLDPAAPLLPDELHGQVIYAGLQEVSVAALLQQQSSAVVDEMISVTLTGRGDGCLTSKADRTRHLLPYLCKDGDPVHLLLTAFFSHGISSL